MAHFDCSHCGEYMGIAYGTCPNCTPAEVFGAKAKYDSTRSNAEEEWEKFVKDAHRHFVDTRVTAAKEEYIKIYNEHAPLGVVKLEL